MTEVAAHDLPAPEREGGKAASTQDELERATQRTGNAILWGCCRRSGRC